MKKPLATMIPLLTRGLAPTAAIASSLLSPLAIAGSGDLDPSFGDVGRVGPMIDFEGPAWSVEPRDDDGILFAGGDSVACASGYYETCDLGDEFDFNGWGFVAHLSRTGSLNGVSDLAILSTVQVLDVVSQRDGKVIAVGRRVSDDGRRQTQDPSALVVFRLERDGTLDRTFGAGGVFQLPFDVDAPTAATSVALGPDGRVVVAGERMESLFRRSAIVIRLLADGTLDNSFGDSGVFSIRSGNNVGFPTHVLRTAGGGYRIASKHGDQCQVVALTADGVVDASFGSSGTAFAAPEPPFSSSLVRCNSMVAQPDGRLLVAGRFLGGGFVTRLSLEGIPDRSFAADDVAGAMVDVTALAVREDGSIIVAGAPRDGVPGALIMQLQASGELDALFGKDGSTWIDLPSEQGLVPKIHDISVLADGHVLAAGGDHVRSGRHSFLGHPFVIRLLGKPGGDSPGVLGFKTPSIEVTEQGHEAVVTVRRMGGDSGRVSVAYQTAAGRRVLATGGEDYTQVTGRLSWADGDTGDQEIRVPITSDTGPPEESEQFLVVLSDTDGGAGLGTRNASVEILGDGYPAGQFAIEVRTPVVTEPGSAHVQVARNYYAAGKVSVRLTLMAGTATAGDDFDAQPVTLTWAAGELGFKSVSIAIRDDATEEQDETFTLQLSSPTGGAIIGPRSRGTITIAAHDEPAVVGWASPAATIDEAGGSIVLNVRRSGDASGAVSVDYSTASGTATAGADFTSASGTLRWADGDSADKTITINTTDDTMHESDETFSVTLSNPSAGATLGSNTAATITIADDDAPGGGGPAAEFTIVADTPQVSEADGFARVHVNVRNLSGLAPVSVTVTMDPGTAMPGEDFAPEPVTLTWFEQSTPQSVDIPIYDDAAQEGIESFRVELSNPTGGAIIGSPSAVAISIAANDQPTPPPPSPAPPVPLSPSGSSGGGRFELLSLLLLGVARVWNLAWLTLGFRRRDASTRRTCQEGRT
jgi:uncharacterized delta-60 repeat protein